MVAAAVAGLAGGGFAAVALAQPTIATDRGCYLVGRPVRLTGGGFAPAHAIVVTLDGVYLGTSETDGQGDLSIPVHPGGLPAGTAQHIDHLRVTDGTSAATTYFTVTRPAGARVLAFGSRPQTVEARFQVWGFSLDGTPVPVYVHYVDQAGRQRARSFLGRTGGQCGSMVTPRRRLFPIAVSSGTWTLQVDTHRAYVRHPDGPVTRIRVTIA